MFSEHSCENKIEQFGLIGTNMRWAVRHSFNTVVLCFTVINNVTLECWRTFSWSSSKMSMCMKLLNYLYIAETTSFFIYLKDMETLPPKRQKAVYFASSMDCSVCRCVSLGSVSWESSLVAEPSTWANTWPRKGFHWYVDDDLFLFMSNIFLPLVKNVDLT